MMFNFLNFKLYTSWLRCFIIFALRIYVLQVVLAFQFVKLRKILWHYFDIALITYKDEGSRADFDPAPGL